MSDRQAKRKRRDTGKLMENLYSRGYTEDDIIRYLEQAVQHPDLIHFEEKIRVSEQELLLKFNRITLIKFQQMHRWLTEILLFLRIIDDAAILEPKYELLLGALQGTARRLRIAFVELKPLALEFGFKKQVEDLRQEVDQRLACVDPLVSLLQDPAIREEGTAYNRTRKLGPPRKKLQAVAITYGEFPAWLIKILEGMDRGGNPREGMSSWRKWLAQEWKKVRLEFPDYSRERCARHLWRQVQDYINMQEYPEELTKEDIETILSILNDVDEFPTQVIKFLSNLEDEYNEQFMT